MNEIFGENVSINGNGNVPYHLPEKRVVPVEKQMKRSIFSGTCNCGQIVDKWYRNFRAFRSKREKGNASKGITFFPKTFHRDEPFHLNSLRNFRKFHSNVSAPDPDELFTHITNVEAKYS